MTTLPPSQDLAPMTGTNADGRRGSVDPNRVKFDEAARVRPIDPAHVDHLAKSIQELGQIQPILLTYVDGRQYLVSGAHRLLACRKLNINVEYVSFSKTMIPEKDWAPFLTMMEIDENMVRTEMTAAERDKMLAMRLENAEAIKALREGGVKSTSRTPNKSTSRTPNGAKNKPRGNAAKAAWFSEAYTDVGMPKQTAHDRWTDYRESIGKPKLTPGKANQSDQEGFREFLRGNAETAAEKAAEAEAERKRAYRDEVCKKLDEIAAEPGGQLAIQHWLKLRNFTESAA